MRRLQRRLDMCRELTHGVMPLVVLPMLEALCRTGGKTDRAAALAVTGTNL